MLVRQEAHFVELIERARQLVDGEAACFVIGCPVADVRHPLLDLFSSNAYFPIGYCGSIELRALLEQEHVRALLDLAIQSGQVQSSNHCGIMISNLEVRSLAAVPIEQPAGLLGFFLIANPLLGDFAQGEHRLLNDYRLAIAPAIERTVRDLYLDLLKGLLTSNADGRDPLQIGIANDGQAKSSQDRTFDDSPYFEVIRGKPRRGRDQSGPYVPQLPSWGRDQSGPYASSQRMEGQFDAVKSEFVSMVSHELRAPLTAIKGYAGLLQAYNVPDRLDAPCEAEMTPARRQQYLHVIMEQVDHLEVLIGDLLDISRIESGRLALCFSEVDIAQLCWRVTRLTQDRVDQQQPGKYQIRCDLDADLPLAWADADRVEQVLQNLLDNGLKYSPDGGLIEVSVCIKHVSQPMHSLFSLETRKRELIADDDGQASRILSITVRDYGIGIPMEQRSQLFKPYSRLAHPATAHVPGIGLGLYITSKFIEAMGGEIMLVSREAEGTSISFSLPLADSNTLLLPQTDFISFLASEKSVARARGRPQEYTLLQPSCPM